ncbi:MAG: phage tail tape measure protein, partial [Planctomycetes bacterium]|nr:phage tail tape measure protein [Planctomycetota bacterium]
MKAEAQIAALPVVATFAQAGMFNLSLATDLLTDAQSALGLSVKDASANMLNMTRVADVLVKANTLANASVKQFSEALTTKAGAALRFLNKDIEEGVAVLAAFADQGIKGAEAGTALNIVLRDLSTKALLNANAFTAASIAVFDSAGNMRNLSLIVADLERALEGMSDQQKKATLLQLGFADKSIIFLQALIGMSDEIANWETALRSAQGITAEIANKQLTRFAKAMNRLSASFTKLGTTIRITDRVAGAVVVLGKAVDATRKFMETLSRISIATIPTWAKMSITFGTAAIALATLVPAIRFVEVALQSFAFVTKLAAAGQALLLSFLGPSGWLILAGAVAAAAGSIAAINVLWGQVTASTDRAVVATKTLTATLNALGLASKNAFVEMDNLERLTNVLAESSNLGATTATQFAEALANDVGPVLRAFNKDIEEGIAVMAVFAEQGIRIKSLGPALKKMFTDLAAVAQDNAAAFKEVGVEVFDSAGQMRNATDIALSFEAALEGLNDPQVRRALRGFGFEPRAARLIQTIVGQSDTLAKFQDTLRDTEIDMKKLAATNAQLAKLGLPPIEAGSSGKTTELDIAVAGSDDAAKQINDVLDALKEPQDFASRFDEFFDGATDFVERLQLQVVQFDLSPF